MDNKVLLFRNFFQSGDTDLIFRKAAELGFDGVEVDMPRENLDAGLEEYARLKKKHGIKELVLNNGINIITDEDQAKAAETITYFKEAIQKAKEILGVSVINTSAGSVLLAEGKDYAEFWENGSILATEVHYKRAADAFKEIAPVAEAENVKLTLEIHNCLIHDLPETTRRLLDMIDSSHVGCNFDMGNMFIHFKWLADPVDFIVKGVDLLKDKIFYVHLKNARKVGETYFVNTDLQDGEIDNRHFFSTLKKIGYEGYFTPEHLGRGDGELSARKYLAYINELLKSV